LRELIGDAGAEAVIPSTRSRHIVMTAWPTGCATAPSATSSNTFDTSPRTTTDRRPFLAASRQCDDLNTLNVDFVLGVVASKLRQYRWTGSVGDRAR